MQAGGEGDDTTFVPTQPSAPKVTAFSIHEEPAPTPSGSIVAIKFNIHSDHYYSVYVRILVGPEGRPFTFATTGTDVIASGIAGPWRFKEVDAGTNHFAYWQKDTHPGGNANLEFRLVAVDKGGNLSEEFYCRLPAN